MTGLPMSMPACMSLLDLHISGRAYRKSGQHSPLTLAHHNRRCVPSGGTTLEECQGGTSERKDMVQKVTIIRKMGRKFQQEVRSQYCRHVYGHT